VLVADVMRSADATRVVVTAPPLAVRIGLAVAIGLLMVGCAYLYAVRGNAIILDLANGFAGMICM
jgi:hypothetical protein